MREVWATCGHSRSSAASTTRISERRSTDGQAKRPGQGAVRLGLARHLATELDAIYRELGALDAPAVATAIRALDARPARDG